MRDQHSAGGEETRPLADRSKGGAPGWRNYPDAHTLHKGGPKAQYVEATDSWWMQPEYQDRAAFQQRTKAVKLKPGMQIATNSQWKWDV